MQSLLNLHCSYGLPLCVSGIAHHLTLSKEMADHDRRREAIKRQRSQARKELHANQDLGTRGNHERVFGEINEGAATLDNNRGCHEGGGENYHKMTTRGQKGPQKGIERLVVYHVCGCAYCSCITAATTM
ncbi:uncharacterized protein LOC115989249 isoform X2 [Quercus lobata]|uniref:uncharacterized protein LOC115989249 isoform X2 n=1 Tax=Quercus lobata TaxID=97700 RepID=UPI0012480544|nr:uncharacterized protein LOC115989249 isoform X2 [Quercus lobata]